MSFQDTKSILICRFCSKKFEVKNIRMKIVLCPDCQRHEKTIVRHAGFNTLSNMSDAQKRAAVNDSTIRYGK